MNWNQITTEISYLQLLLLLGEAGWKLGRSALNVNTQGLKPPEKGTAVMGALGAPPASRSLGRNRLHPGNDMNLHLTYLR